jgi:hypothetical protein
MLMKKPGPDSCTQLPSAWRHDLERRVRKQIECEVNGDVTALHEFTLPSIRASRNAEHSFEPEHTLSEIRKFVALIRQADVRSVEIGDLIPGGRSGSPAALVVVRVQYNQRDFIDEFRGLWVYTEDTWFNTSLGKIEWPVNHNE